MRRNDRDRKRLVHLYDQEGYLRCNPRDKEAAHRAAVGEIAVTDDPGRATCSRCRRAAALVWG